VSSIQPVSNSTTKVYIERRRWGRSEGRPVSISSQGGEPAQIVDDPGSASETVSIHIDGRPVDRSSAIRLSKAALKEQDRQRKGKKQKGVVDQIVAELSAPNPSRKSSRRGSFSWKGWAVFGCIGWIALVIAAGVPLGILLTPIFGPIMGWMAGGMLALVGSEARRQY